MLFRPGTVYLITAQVVETIGGLKCEFTHKYVGSTCQSLKSRFAGHKTEAAKGNKSPLYDRMRCASYVNIEILERQQFGTVENLRLREEYYRRLIMPDLNVRRAAVTAEERQKYQKNKCAAYYQANREALIARSLARYYSKKAAKAAPAQVRGDAVSKVNE